MALKWDMIVEVVCYISKGGGERLGDGGEGKRVVVGWGEGGRGMGRTRMR